MAGRRPEPTAIKKQKGNPGKRALNEREPTPTIKRPPKPRHLTGEAAKEWRRIVPLLLGMRVLSEADRAAVAMYCQAWARWVAAEEQIAALAASDQLVTSTENGYPVASPWLSISSNAAKQLKSLAAELGLTPSARSKVTTIAEADQDELGKLLDRR